ncbi:matrixin family metalloprotease [bacterium]|nr:matrixin family metalloprotease [bacterium]
MPLSRPGLRVESLEPRDVPTALGSPWPDPGTLTLSFAADGTRVGDHASDTATAFGGQSAEVWQREVLRAFQTWVVYTDANIAVVADGGAAFGAPGQAQGDFRFGDVRVGAVPLSDDSLANVSAFDWGIGTWSGDLLFNTRARFAALGVTPTTAADVFTVALHEAGHVFGMEHSDDPASPMYKTYTGVKTGLTAGDVALLRQYYGTRQPDAYEGSSGNDTASRATPVDTVTGAARLTADIGTTADADAYSLLNTTLLGTLEVRVRASGISLLTPKVQVYDGWGRLVAAGTAAGPGQDVTLRLPLQLLNLGYVVKVTGATGDVFGIGGYELSVVRTDGLVLPHLLTETLGGNGLLGAVELDGLLSGTAPDAGYAADARVDSRADVDYYSVRVPPTTDAAPRALVVSVTNTSGGAHPDVAVYDAAGRPVPFQILHNDGATLTVQVTQIRRGGQYYLEVSSPADEDATGRYHLTADFQAPVAVQYRRLAAGTLTADAPTATATLTVEAARLHEFLFTTSGAATLTVRDAAGNVVLTLGQSAGGTTNGAVYLAPGTYTVEIAGGPTECTAGVREASGPVGPYDPGTSTTYPEPPPPPPPSGGPAPGSEPLPPPPPGDGTGTYEAPPPPPYFSDVTEY